MQIYYPIVHGKLSHEIWWLLPHCFTVISICIYMWSDHCDDYYYYFCAKDAKIKHFHDESSIYLIFYFLFVMQLVDCFEIGTCICVSSMLLANFAEKVTFLLFRHKHFPEEFSSLFCILRHVVPLFVYSISPYTCPSACEAIEKCATTTTTTRRKW